MQIKRIALLGIIMAAIMLSGCRATVQKSTIREEKKQETGKTEQESMAEKDTNMNEKESFNAESNINDIINDSAFDGYGTYACVGTSDGIASYRSMVNYISQIEQNGTNAKIEVFKGLSHGFGLGEGTVAEGWIDHAISFWEDNMNASDKR